jgi:hypothetical protein
MSRAPWTARCKSGYLFAGKPCQCPTRRGALLCDGCLTAEVVPAAARPAGLVARALVAAAAALLAGLTLDFTLSVLDIILLVGVK